MVVMKNLFYLYS